MTARVHTETLPSAFAYENTDIPVGLTICEWREQGRCAAPAPARMAVATVAAITMSGWRVIVTESRCAGLVETCAARYVSPPQTEEQARSLIALLASGDAAGSGPWRHPVAGGQRLIELEAQR